MEEISILDNKFKSMNSEDKNTFINKKDLSRKKPKNNEISKIIIPSNYTNRNSNTNLAIKNGIYIKKKLLIQIEILEKKEKMMKNYQLIQI